MSEGITAWELMRRLLFERLDASYAKELLRYLWEQIEKETKQTCDKGVYSQWVSVNDREPVKSNLYITCNDKGEVGVDWYRTNPEGQEYKWADALDCNYDDFEVKYWMEFPDAPNQKGGTA